MKSSKSRPRLTYANVVATLALFIALGGGAYAATVLPAGSVGTRQLREGAVTGSKVKEGSLVGADFAPGELPSGPRGERGALGPQGEIGERGPRGLEGKAGAEGAAGQRGERGAPGPEGKPGADGNAGPRGERGAPGPEGGAGDPGPRGERGTRGERGPAGERGPEGEPGPAGERGPEGPAGEPGTVRTVVRYGPVATIGPRPFASYATCRKGESVTGGGFDVLQASGVPFYVVRTDRASTSEPVNEEELRERAERGEEIGGEGEVFGEEEGGGFFVYRDPRDGSAASGWAVSLGTAAKEEETKTRYRAYVVCASSARLLG